MTYTFVVVPINVLSCQIALCLKHPSIIVRLDNDSDDLTLKDQVRLNTQAHFKCMTIESFLFF